MKEKTIFVFSFICMAISIIFSFFILWISFVSLEDEKNFQEELTEDLIAIIHHFSMKFYGKRKNKVVFCLVEHKDIVEQLYKRYEVLATFSSEHEDEEPVEEPKQSSSVQQHRNSNTKTTGTSRSRKYDRDRW